MLRIIITTVLSASFFAFSTPLKNDIRIIKFDELERIMEHENGKITIINFWATWCAPCVEELPYFEEVLKKHNPEQVEIFLISLDFANQVNKVLKFVERKEIKNKVLLLDEVDYNSWIDKVEPSWSGAIPATLIIDKNRQRHFIEGQIDVKKLDELISKYNH